MAPRTRVSREEHQQAQSGQSALFACGRTHGAGASRAQQQLQGGQAQHQAAQHLVTLLQAAHERPHVQPHACGGVAQAALEARKLLVCRDGCL